MKAFLVFVFIVFLMASCSQIISRELNPSVTYEFGGVNE